MTTDKDYERFINRYHIHKLDITYMNDGGIYKQWRCNIQMDKVHLEHLIDVDSAYLDIRNEEELRKNNPTLQTAWEEYKILVKLIRIEE